ncbi:MAG: hypothetical protein UEM14_11835 [Faecalibacterium prausnitzii]|jgi:hypothetical protein|nr:hypothetical protein [Faecalibacterium prausnitzii]DAZ22632.1 MAG TPA: hypothetical protein [Caudoviricetes sp.]
MIFMVCFFLSDFFLQTIQSRENAIPRSISGACPTIDDLGQICGVIAAFIRQFLHLDLRDMTSRFNFACPCFKHPMTTSYLSQKSLYIS